MAHLKRTEGWVSVMGGRGGDYRTMMDACVDITHLWPSLMFVSSLMGKNQIKRLKKTDFSASETRDVFWPFFSLLAVGALKGFLQIPDKAGVCSDAILNVI